MSDESEKIDLLETIERLGGGHFTDVTGTLRGRNTVRAQLDQDTTDELVAQKGKLGDREYTAIGRADKDGAIDPNQTVYIKFKRNG